MTDLDLRGKRVFIRADLNVPQDDAGNITDDTRIRASVPGIRHALDAGARVMVTSHLGRPNGGRVQAGRLARPGGRAPVRAARASRCRSSADWLEGGEVAPGPGQVVLLENCRFNKGEKKDDEALARKMAALCDVYVNDAFGTAHRAEATTHGIAKFAPVACAGPLMAAEIEALSKALANPARPLVAIVGGSKVSTKLTILGALAEKVDQLIVGGGIANTFMLAVGGKIGKSLAEADLAGEARNIVKRLEEKGGSVPIPIDVVCAKEFSATARAEPKATENVADDDLILDIGPQSARALAHFLTPAGTIVWNGPVGVFEFDAVRRRHPRGGERDRIQQGVLARGRRRHACRDREVRRQRPDLATSPPAAAPSSSFSRARRCPRSRCWRRAVRERPLACPAARVVTWRPENPNYTRMAMAERNRSTKIVATLGPASSDPTVLERMFRAGVDVVRLNFSHGTADDHLQRAELVREAVPQDRAHRRHHGRPAGSEDPRRQVQGRQGHAQERAAAFILDAECELGDETRVGLDYKELPRDVKPGDVLLLDDGKIVFDVEQVTATQVHSTVAPRRRALEQQGHQPPRRRPHRARAHRQGHGGHPHRGEAQGRLPRGVVPQERRATCTWRASCCARPAARRS